MVFLVALLLASFSLVAAEEKLCVEVYGYESCGYYQRALCWARSLDSSRFQTSFLGRTRDDYQEKLRTLKQSNPSIDVNHRTSPMVLVGPCDAKLNYVGGSDAFVSFLKQKNIAKPEACW